MDRELSRLTHLEVGWLVAGEGRSLLGSRFEDPPEHTHPLTDNSSGFLSVTTFI